MKNRRLLVVDAPGGPRPAQYLPSLCAEYDVTVVWLAVEPAAAQARRRDAVGVAAAAVAVTSPEELPDALRRVAADHHPEGIVAFSERVVHVAQRVAGELGLTANRPATLHALQDKQTQRALLAKAGLDVPRPMVLRTERDCADAADSMRFPAVLKPAVGMGSIATFQVQRAVDLLSTWRTAGELVATDSRIAQYRPAILLEEQLVGIEPVDVPGLGDYLSVEALTWEGRSHVLAVSDKLPLSHPFRENAHILPSARTPAQLRPVLDCVLLAHQALDISHGVTHTEVKLTAEGPRIIEINGRVGGGVTEEMLLAAGYDLPLQLARSALGTAPDTNPVFHRYASFLTPQPPSGRHLVRQAPTEAELRAAFSELVEVTHVVEVGQTVDSAIGTASNLVKGFAAAPRHRDLVDLANRITASGHFVLDALDNETTGVGS
jgi:biotin carboxylase